MSAIQLSGVVTSFNNAASIEACLRSLLPLCTDVVLLDSGSTDGTCELARALGVRVEFQAFAGYSAQKTAAIALARHDWIVLLDSDEALDAVAQTAIAEALNTASAQAHGYRLARRERIFWRYQHVLSKHNHFLRVFDRRFSRLSTQAVHESVVCNGTVRNLPGYIIHDGDRGIELKADKLNRYSSLAASEKRLPSRFALAWRVSLYPAWYFFRAYVLRRQFLNGWAGYINSVQLAHYVFLKYAKLLERRIQQISTSRS